MTSKENGTLSPSDGPELSNELYNSKYQRRHLASFPDPIGLSTLSLTDELGNGGFHSKMYSAPYEANHIYNGPMLPVILSKNRDVQCHVDLLHISEAYASRKKKLNILMRDETRGFVTGVQKSFLSNDESLSIESYRLMHSRGNRIRRFDNLSRWLNEDPIDGKSGYAHSWSSLSATSDGKRVVTLDYRGKPRWHDILENDKLTDGEQALPATKWKIVESQVNEHNQHNNLLKCKQYVYKGIELKKGAGSSDTFQLLLLKSSKNFQLQKVYQQSDDKTISQQIITNVQADNRNILDGCLLSMGIPGFYNHFAMIDDKGQIYAQNLESAGASGKKCIGNLDDEQELSSNQDISCWASIQASSTGDYLYAATRKAIKLFDVRSRPQYKGVNSKLFAIPKDRDTESSCEMIGGILNSHEMSESLLYFCSNIRIGAVDKRMPGRAYLQVQLHTSPSFSKKVALPSGLASFSFAAHNYADPSRLDYLAAWMPYSSTSQINFPAAVVACFDQSYNYCTCRNSKARPYLPFSLEECQNGDHSDGSNAPLVVRGNPLRIAGPLSCIDFSEDQITNRISLPCTGLVISKLHGTKNTGSSELSILSNNVAGDIFMTELAEKKGKMENDSYNSNCYDWMNFEEKDRIQCDRTEQLREELVKKWWVCESTFVDLSSAHEASMTQIRFGHLKRANFIFNLKPYAYLNSNSNVETQIGYKPTIKKYVDDDRTKSEVSKVLIDGKLKNIRSIYTPEYRQTLSAAGLLDSHGRISYSKEKARDKQLEKLALKKIRLLAGAKKAAETKRRKNGGVIVCNGRKEASAKKQKHTNKMRKSQLELIEECPSIRFNQTFSQTCPSLKAINPSQYSGPQGIRSNEQLSGRKLDTNLQIPRVTYYSSKDELSKTYNT